MHQTNARRGNLRVGGIRQTEHLAQDAQGTEKLHSTIELRTPLKLCGLGESVGYGFVQQLLHLLRGFLGGFFLLAP